MLFTTTLAAGLRILVSVLVAAFLTSELRLLRDNVSPGFRASTAKPASWRGQLRSAGVELAPMTNARNWASWYVTLLFVRFVSWWIVDAAIGTALGTHGCLPRPGPENIVIITGPAFCTAR